MGTGCNWESRIYIWVLDIGLPMGKFVAPSATLVTLYHEENVVFSVGPYT